jgi:hemerythrin-like metal-binding protein
MPLIQWTDALSVGHDAIDRDHRRLVDTVNGLHEAMLAGQGMGQVHRALDDIVAHTADHFRREEKIMADAAYPAFAEHKREHDRLVEEIAQLRQRFEAGESIYSLRVLQFLSDWLIRHINATDRPLGQYLAQRRDDGPAG